MDHLAVVVSHGGFHGGNTFLSGTQNYGVGGVRLILRHEVIEK